MDDPGVSGRLIGLSVRLAGVEVSVARAERLLAELRTELGLSSPNPTVEAGAPHLT